MRLEVSPRFEHGLSIGAKQAGDLEVQASGLTILDRWIGASRADSVAIDMVKTAQGPAFKVTNPNEPARVRPISASELKARLDSDEKPRLLDVRTPEERDRPYRRLRAPRSEGGRAAAELDRGTLLVFHCHHAASFPSAPPSIS